MLRNNINFRPLEWLLFRPFEIGRYFVVGYVLVFFLLFVFQTKSATTNNHQTGLRDESYLSPFRRDSKKFSVSKKPVWNFLFERISKVLSNCNSLFKLDSSRENVFYSSKDSFWNFFSSFFFQNCFSIDLFFMTLNYA